MFSSDCVWQIWSAISSIVGWINGIHGGDGVVQVGKSDRVDMIFVDCDFYFQLFITQSKL